MKKLLIHCLAIGLLFSCQQIDDADVVAEETSAVQEESREAEVESLFDSIRAAKLGADQYGMRKYVMAFLKRGPNRELDSVYAAQLQAAHMQNIGKMAEAGKLALAGPFYGDGDLRGIYIFAVDNIEEAKALTESDPAIQAGSLEMELIEWYGSAGLMEVNEIHKTISKIFI